MTPSQPYSFSGNNPVGTGLKKVGQKAAGYFQGKASAAQMELQHQYRVREMAIGSSLQTESQKELTKTAEKQSRKTIKAQGKAAAKEYGTRLAHGVASAQQMAGVAAPGTPVNIGEKNVSFTTPGATKKGTPAETSTPKKQPSLSRRSQIGKSMRKRGK